MKFRHGLAPGSEKVSDNDIDFRRYCTNRQEKFWSNLAHKQHHRGATTRRHAGNVALNSEPKALTGDKSEGIKSRGAAEAFIRGFSPVKAEGEEFNVLILSYTRELSRPFKENKG